MNPVKTSKDEGNSKTVTRVGLTEDGKKDIHILTINDNEHTLLRNTNEGIQVKHVKAKFHHALVFAVDLFDGE